MQSSPSVSLANSDEERLLNALAKLNLDGEGKSERQELAQEDPQPSSVAHVTKLCASFVRATTILANIGRCDGAPYYVAFG